MSSFPFRNGFRNNNNTHHWPNVPLSDNPLMNNNASMFVDKPCPPVAPVYYISNIYGSPTGWNAALVGLLSCVLALIFLLVCLYYLGYRRRRYTKEVNDAHLQPSPVQLIDKTATTIPLTTSSQTATTTFINETSGKETKLNTYTEQTSGMITNNNVGGDFAVNMPPLLGNGHAPASSNNGLLVNGTTDPSELRLLQHEHH